MILLPLQTQDDADYSARKLRKSLLDRVPTSCAGFDGVAAHGKVLLAAAVNAASAVARASDSKSALSPSPADVNIVLLQRLNQLSDMISASSSPRPTVTQADVDCAVFDVCSPPNVALMLAACAADDRAVMTKLVSLACDPRLTGKLISSADSMAPCTKPLLSVLAMAAFQMIEGAVAGNGSNGSNGSGESKAAEADVSVDDSSAFLSPSTIFWQIITAVLSTSCTQISSDGAASLTVATIMVETAAGLLSYFARDRKSVDLHTLLPHYTQHLPLLTEFHDYVCTLLDAQRAAAGDGNDTLAAHHATAFAVFARLCAALYSHAEPAAMHCALDLNP